MTPEVDIVVPIYDGLEETRSCLESLVAHPQQTPHELILINDMSPNPDMAPMLERFAGSHDHVTLLHNRRNLGFVGTVNRGMRLHGDRDVVLLNSDTRVANNWLDRLVQAAHQEEGVATVTPFSNNATICSFPRFCEYNPLPPGWSLEELDALFAHINAGEVREIPTGVGFCMFISRAALNAVGLFDEERFGRGYGEENDFCRRVAKSGWKNLLCGDTLVYHHGGVSFSSEQETRIARAQEILDRLHPEYHTLVQEHIERDPAALLRFRVLIEMYRTSPRHKILHVTHHLGGGTLKHIRELSTFLEGRMDSLLLRPNHDGQTSLYFGTEGDSPSLAFDLPRDYPALREVLEQLGLSRIHFHHTLGLETSTWGLPSDLGIPFDITLHDYYFINAHPTQTDADGRYQPILERQAVAYPLPIPLTQWQENQKKLLFAAERVIAPSQAALREIQRHFPDLKATVTFHPDTEQQMPWPDVRTSKHREEPLRILVLGALSLEKGADLLEKTAREAHRKGLDLEFHLLGYAYRPLDDCVVCHGPYSQAELPIRIREIAPHLAWFTALWPETYSYTLSEALAAGLPIVVPDLGAFPERVANRPLTWIEPWQRSPADWVDFFLRLAGELEAASGTPLPWKAQPDSPGGKRFYRSLYLQGTPPSPPDPVLTDERLARLISHSQRLRSGSRRSRREAILRHLLTLRRSRIGYLMSRVVPVRIQRHIKRKLSRKPIHELDN